MLFHMVPNTIHQVLHSLLGISLLCNVVLVAAELAFVIVGSGQPLLDAGPVHQSKRACAEKKVTPCDRPVALPPISAKTVVLFHDIWIRQS